MQHPKVENCTFEHNTKTRWRDMDALGHINHATVLTYIEDARTQILQHWNLMSSKEESIIVAAIHIDYFQQIQHPAALVIGTSISRIGNTSFDLSSWVYQNHQRSPAAKATVTAVCFDYSQQQPVSVFPQIRSQQH